MGINSSNKSVSVGTSLVTLSEQKSLLQSQRVRLIITNTSTAGQIISIAADGEAVAGSGLVLYPGGSQSWEVQANLQITQSRITAIADAVSGSVSVYEEVLQ